MPDPFDFFTFYNRFFDQGWPGVLKPTEAMVWLATLKHAARDTGEAYPGSRRLAGYLGQSDPKHVRAARGRLVTLGLLVEVRAGGGKATSVYRIALPGKLPPRAKSAPGEIDPGPNPPRPESAPSPRAKSGTQTDQGTDQESHHHNSTAAAVGGEFSSGEEGRAKPADGLDPAVSAMLWRDLKINKAGQRKIAAACPGLTETVARSLFKRASEGGAKNPTGLFVSLACEDGPELVAVELQEKAEREATRRQRDQQRAAEAEIEESRMQALRASFVPGLEEKFLADPSYPAEAEAIRARHGDIIDRLAVKQLLDLDAVKQYGDEKDLVAVVQRDFSPAARAVLAVDAYRRGEVTSWMGTGELNIHSNQYKKEAARAAREAESRQYAIEAAQKITEGYKAFGCRALKLADNLWELHGPDGGPPARDCEEVAAFTLELMQDEDKAFAEALNEAKTPPGDDQG